MDLDKALDIVKDFVGKYYDEEVNEHMSHMTLYKIAQECCYGLNSSELRCLRDACEDILKDREQ